MGVRRAQAKQQRVSNDSGLHREVVEQHGGQAVAQLLCGLRFIYCKYKGCPCVLHLGTQYPKAE